MNKEEFLKVKEAYKSARTEERKKNNRVYYKEER